MNVNSHPSYFKNLLLLNLIVFIWGFTGILGKFITLPSADIVWYRMLIAVVVLTIYIISTKIKLKSSPGQIFMYLLVGGMIALHWITFFEAIKLSNVSLALSFMATTSFFTSLIEPVLFRRKIVWYELLISLLVIFGIFLIFRFEFRFTTAIFIALLSAFLAALFTVLNAKFVKQDDSRVITLYELAGGWILLSVYFLISGKFTSSMFDLSLSDSLSLLVLGVICTAFAFVVSVEIMKIVSAYTVAITVNLEPIYSIILALIIFGESEKMTGGFYTGASIILLAIILNVYLKRIRWKKNLWKAS